MWAVNWISPLVVWTSDWVKEKLSGTVIVPLTVSSSRCSYCVWGRYRLISIGWKDALIKFVQIRLSSNTICRVSSCTDTEQVISGWVGYSTWQVSSWDGMRCTSQFSLSTEMLVKDSATVWVTIPIELSFSPLEVTSALGTDSPMGEVTWGDARGSIRERSNFAAARAPKDKRKPVAVTPKAT